MYELDGQRLKIYNDTNETIKDLIFVLPGTTIESNVKKLKPNTHVDEHIYDKYKGALTFFFKRNEEAKYTFENVIGIPEDQGIAGHDFEHKYSLQFRIVEKEDQLVIIKEDYID